MKIVHCP